MIYYRLYVNKAYLCFKKETCICIEGGFFLIKPCILLFFFKHALHKPGKTWILPCCFVYITILHHVLDYFRHNHQALLTSVVNTTSRLPVNLCFRKAVITAPIASSIAVTMPTNRKFVITTVSWRTVS